MNWVFKSDRFIFVLKGIMSDFCVTRGNVTVSIVVQYCGAERWNLDFSRRTVRPYFLITLIPSFTDLLPTLILLFYEEHYLSRKSTYWTLSIWTANLSPFGYVSLFICEPAVYMHACMHVCMFVCVYVCVCIYIFFFLSLRTKVCMPSSNSSLDFEVKFRST